MKTNQVIQKYFEALDRKGGWEQFVADDIAFDSPGAKTKGKDAYVQGTTQFLQVVTSAKINQLIVEGQNACVLSHYNLLSPSGKSAESEVAEILVVENDQIQSSTIFFDTAAFHAFLAS